MGDNFLKDGLLRTLIISPLLNPFKESIESNLCLPYTPMPRFEPIYRNWINILGNTTLKSVYPSLQKLSKINNSSIRGGHSWSPAHTILECRLVWSCVGLVWQLWVHEWSRVSWPEKHHFALTHPLVLIIFPLPLAQLSMSFEGGWCRFSICGWAFH